MPVASLHIESFLNHAHESIILDVRSPGEYGHAHIPGAHSLPIFDNEQRKIIGTAYKQESREIAVNLGLDFFSTRMKPMVAATGKIIASSGIENPLLCIHCWRGGLRSEAVAWLLNLYGFRVCLLKGGYKSYRRWALKQFEKEYHFHLLGGYTGSGKTELLAQLKQEGRHTVDLEALASHKGSAFGHLGQEPQPSQEMFENILAFRLSGILAGSADAIIWLEDESRHIGKCGIPPHIWQQMRNSPVYFLEIPQSVRLQFIVKGYGGFPLESLEAGIWRIQKRLGGLATRQAIEFLQQGNIENCFKILLDYYDKLYKHSLYKRENEAALLHSIHCDDIKPGNTALLKMAMKPEKS